MKSIFNASYRKVIGWLAAERRYQKISQSEANELLGLKATANFVSKVENFERRIDLNEYVDICLVLGLDPHEGLDLLIEGKKKRRPNDLS